MNRFDSYVIPTVSDAGRIPPSLPAQPETAVPEAHVNPWRTNAVRGLGKALFVLGAGYAGLYLGDRYGRSPRESMLVMLSGVALGVGFVDTFAAWAFTNWSRMKPNDEGRMGEHTGGAILGGLLNREGNLFRANTGDEDEWYRRAVELSRETMGDPRDTVLKVCSSLPNARQRASCEAFFADAARFTSAQVRASIPLVIAQASKIRAERE